ncbi:putative transmembrane protein [Gregarina niphandrodes]|uniref:Transmembrane protein n=1 Tax=Gregarina niphandrodes TaxID=110365 RepID=A0A023B1T5_GRENI|nr:putative transmembrane protein [Gregarina niphandrodes]EZG46747.1 putative transmembrane protein [Gregarina niphandrodes]|eukprot:XP_011132256.1 putative transmembrane protein [Gregarina niphandrodes]
MVSWTPGKAEVAVGKFMHLFASLLTLVVGLVHLSKRKPRIHWPDSGFITDNNIYWRYQMFSFAPSVFIDNWTAVVLGGWGIMSHLQVSGRFLGAPAKSFITASIFLIFMGLFGTLAYAGGLGIIFSIFTFLAAVIALVLAFTNNQSASLEIH